MTGVQTCALRSAHSNEPPETLTGKLKASGQPDPTLIGAIGGETEYGDRSKDNFFRNEGRGGMDAIAGALECLKREEEQHWSRGIELLANWVAALARKKEEISGELPGNCRDS